MKCYAIIPAAGRSRRMGQPKLLLPWPLPDGGSATIIDCVLRTWVNSSVSKVVVVVGPDDKPLESACERWPVAIVRLQGETTDMKGSILVGLQYLKETCQPAPEDWCFLAPADLPTLRGNVIDAMARTEKASTGVIVPTFGGKAGHPVLLSWPKTAEIARLPPDQGLDRIVADGDKTVIEFMSQERPTDVDTLDAYVELRNRFHPK